MNATWLAAEREGDAQFRIGNIGPDLVVAEWTAGGRLVARRDGSAWQFTAASGASSELVEKLHRGSIPSLIHHLNGELALHGSAVATSRGALVFIGVSGQGKSTLAAWLCTQGGMSLLADDASLLTMGESEWFVRPQERHHYLAPDALAAIRRPCSSRRRPTSPAATSVTRLDAAAVEPLRGGIERLRKGRINALRYQSTSAPLRGLVSLVFEENRPPELGRLHDVTALAAVVPNVVRFVLDDPQRNLREFESVTRLIAAVPVYRFSRPRELAELGAASQWIDSILGQE